MQQVRSPAFNQNGRPQAQVSLIQAMEEACDQIDAVAVQGSFRHSRRFFPRFLANEDVNCDVEESPGQIFYFTVLLTCTGSAVFFFVYFLGLQCWDVFCSDCLC
ncbi:hypothetical protein ATANTOWER_031402 [Ataeniobius toweri]|uniref:Uncharacterized protein n=1 Tax=Ataeniobius toweri TaxID=208326 RepID=A0ABU7BDH4_9TELE|nr:hypothetical protein [Ataeniobius toweri]